MPDFTFQNLTPGYLDSRTGLFVALTSLEVSSGKGNLPKNVKPCIRGDVKSGPYDYAADGIVDTDSDGIADDPNDATSSQYLIPKQGSLLPNTHFYVKKAPGLTGGAATSLLLADNVTLAAPSTISITTTPPGQSPGDSLGKPNYWYAVIDPAGSAEDLIPGSFVEISLNPTLPYAVIYQNGFGVVLE